MMVWLLVGCSLLPGKQFPFGFVATDAAPELQGVLTDKTGSVVRVTTVQAVNPAPPIERGMMTFADRPNSVMVHWLGGACDASPAILVTPDGGVTITVTTATRPGVCDAVAVPRYVIIELGGPVDLSRTTVRFEP